MSYRPIADLWFLTRAKLKGGEKYYGAYLGGFPERARVLLGCPINEPLLHVCGGKARLYPYAGGFGPYDATLDLDPELKPNHVWDAKVPYTFIPGYGDYDAHYRAMLADPPYSAEDAKNYAPGAANYPSPNLILKNMIDALPVGGRAGIIHYILPKPPSNTKFLAVAAVYCGFNNRGRTFSVFEKTS